MPHVFAKWVAKLHIANVIPSYHGPVAAAAAIAAIVDPDIDIDMADEPALAVQARQGTFPRCRVGAHGRRG